MKLREVKLIGIACFLGGVVTGFLLSPVKKGLYLGNNCGNHYPDKKDTEVNKINNPESI